MVIKNIFDASPEWIKLRNEIPDSIYDLEHCRQIRAILERAREDIVRLKHDKR